MQTAITDHLSTNQYELLMVEFSQMGYYDITTDIPSYIDQHNVEYEIMQRTYETEKSPLRRLLAKSEWKKYRDHEIENCEKFMMSLHRPRKIHLHDHKAVFNCYNLGH